MDQNETLLDARFKDASPMATVEKIKKILADHEIETDEVWHETTVPYCFALSVKIRNASFSVNGKGMDREFALASAYGELMERLQLGFTGASSLQKDGTTSLEDSNTVFVSGQSLLEDLPRYQRLSERYGKIMGNALLPQSLVQGFTEENGLVSCVPCYELTRGVRTVFPNKIRMRVYGSNGCAAGNTMEEAIVQAISELVERYNQSYISFHDIAAPEVPEEVLRSCTAAYGIIQYVRSKGYRVTIKDCSLGKGFPVVCAVFVHEKTGKYHTNFGAYPVFEIALQRALTESFQGRDLDTIAEFEKIVWDHRTIKPLDHLSGDFFKGSSPKSANFFFGRPAYEYDPDSFFKGGTNLELLKECIDHFKAQGYEILVYDSSTLGFPTCQVVIPGYSEIFVNRLSSMTDGFRYSRPAIHTLRYPSRAGMGDKLGFLMHLNQMAQFTPMADSYRFLNMALLTADILVSRQTWLMNATLGSVYYSLGRLQDALRCVEQMIPGENAEETARLIVLKRYLELRQRNEDQNEIRRILSAFHDDTVTAPLFDAIDNGKDPLEWATLHCDGSCNESCPLFGKCRKDDRVSLEIIIKKGASSLSFDDFVDKLQSILL